MKMIGLIWLPVLGLSACLSAPSLPCVVMTGCEQTSLYLPLLKGQSVALVANHTSMIGNSHLADSLIKTGIRLVKIFSPEHGFRGEAGAGDIINSHVDGKTGLPVISLYGSKTKPDTVDLQDIDIVVFDIQDVGVRFYTYISTMHYVMEACAEKNIPLIVLDRPDPLGSYVDGPILKSDFRSFVGLHPIPVVYGMTIGELAQMINGEGWLSAGLKCNLTVIPCKNYQHDTLYSLPFNPSPNLNSMEAIYLYPSLCLFEGTMMSLGRGTLYPFRVIGHPDYPVKSFSFTPQPSAINKNPLYAGQICYGIDLRSLSLEDLRQSGKLDLKWLIGVYHTMERGEQFFSGYFNQLAGTDSLKTQIMAGWSEERIRNSWQADLAKFSIIRKKYLLYEDFKAK